MSTISVKNLTKYFSVHKKDAGLAGSLKSLIHRKYETVKAVDNVSFTIEEGELIGFIGPNGAGKTTTLKCLSGLLYPTSGNLSVLNHTPFKREKSFLKQIALIMGQKNQLWWDLPAIDTFLLQKEIYEISDTLYKERLSELVTLLEVQEFLNLPVKKLSLGQRMKMELIAALLHNPKVLFLDEPTIGLDVVMQKKLREFVYEYNQRYKATVLLTSHYMKDVETLCKRVLVINHGKLLYDGLLDTLVKKFAPYKVMKVILQKQIDPKKLESFGTIKLFEFPQLVLTVSTKKSGEVAAKLLKNFPVEDLNIEDPEIEEVIREVFQKNAQ